MVHEANKHHRALEFKVGDRVFLKFRPYRQRSLFAISRQKLAPSDLTRSRRGLVLQRTV